MVTSIADANRCTSMDLHLTMIKIFLRPIMIIFQSRGPSLNRTESSVTLIHNFHDSQIDWGNPPRIHGYPGFISHVVGKPVTDHEMVLARQGPFKFDAASSSTITDDAGRKAGLDRHDIQLVPKQRNILFRTWLTSP